jgi:hypothetical protein
VRLPAPALRPVARAFITTPPSITMSQDYDRDDDDDGYRGSRKEHRGTLILILGILSLVVCAPLGIAAWMMGSKDLAEMKAGRMDPSGKDTTQIGYILGIVGSILFAISLIGVCLWFAIVGAAVGAGG